MPLALLQSCCSGPGLATTAGNSIGNMTNLEDGQSAAPCWCPGLAADFYPRTIGYDSDRDWIIVAYPNTGVVYYYDARDCSILDGMTRSTMIDDATGSAFFTDHPSAAGIPAYTQGVGWFGYSKRGGSEEYRLYGQMQWSETAEEGDGLFHYLVFSVDQDGGDYNEEINLAVDDTDGGYGQFTISGEDIMFAAAAGSVDVKVRANGGAVTVITGTTSGAPLVNAGGVAGTVGGGIVVLGDSIGFMSGTGDRASSQISFAFTKDGTDFAYVPGGIGWSDKFGGLMVLWINFDDLDPPSRFYVTLSTAALIPGNILGQAGTTVYDYIPRGGAATTGGFIGYQPPEIGNWHTCINFCQLPRPSDLEPADVEVPEPSCESIYDGCEAPGPAQVLITFATNSTIVDDGADHPFLEERFDSVLNGDWVFDNALTFDVAQVVCVANDKRGFIILINDFTDTSGTLEDRYARRGDKLYRKNTTAGVSMSEFWICELGIEVVCVEGYIYLSTFTVACLEFVFEWDGSDWVLAGMFDVRCIESYTEIRLRYPARLMPDCTTILDPDSHTYYYMITDFEYDVGGSPAAAPGLQVIAWIGDDF
jgi:hypothetical protein